MKVSKSLLCAEKEKVCKKSQYFCTYSYPLRFLYASLLQLGHFRQFWSAIMQLFCNLMTYVSAILIWNYAVFLQTEENFSAVLICKNAISLQVDSNYFSILISCNFSATWWQISAILIWHYASFLQIHRCISALLICNNATFLMAILFQFSSETQQFFCNLMAIFLH